MFILSSSLVQVSGAGVWEKNVELAGFSPGRCGAFTQKAGPRTTPTACSPTNPRARGLALKCVSGTRTSSNGRFQNGDRAFYPHSSPTSSNRGRWSASRPSTASRGARSTACAPQTARWLRRGYVSSFPRGRRSNRPAWSPALTTASYLISPPGPAAVKHAGWVSSIGPDTF